MIKGIHFKFEQNPDLLAKLLATGDAKLVEDSDVDMYWGGSLPGSKNVLGKMLMQFREGKRKMLA